MLKIIILSLALAIPALIPAAAEAGCGINLGVKNNDAGTISVYNYIHSSARTRGGTWLNLYRGNWGSYKKDKWTLAAGETYRDNYQADFSCKKKRRYKIYHRCGQSTRVTYYPSPTGWTTRQSITINLSCN